jgi:hypothetical protein
MCNSDTNLTVLLSGCKMYADAEDVVLCRPVDFVAGLTACGGVGGSL